MRLDSYLIPQKKLIKTFKDLSGKAKTIKLIEGSIGVNLVTSDLAMGS
jgi:hypothetical protein